jgi:hypothetical protein
MSPIVSLEKYIKIAMDKSMFLKYITYINTLISSGIKIEEIHKDREFKIFRKENSICIRDAQLVDRIFLGYSGGFWLSAYDVIEDRYKNDVGILTFNMY